MPTYDLVIVGGGAAGSEAAFTVADGGRHRILLAESSHFGGTCTNHGCVPTKALVKAARIAHTIRTSGQYGVRAQAPILDWPAIIGRAYQVRDHMLRFGSAPFEEAGVEVRYPAQASLAGEHCVRIDGETVEARAVLLAAGLDPALPPVPGLREAGYLDNESALDLKELPGRLVVLGCGPIGSEFAQIFARLGVRVTVIEALDRLLAAEEPESGQALADVFSEEGIQMRLGARVERVERAGSSRRLHLQGGEMIEADEILVAAGRSLNGEGLGLDAAGIDWTPKGVTVDSQLRTSQPWAWAAGDVVGRPLFTHVASLMGQVAARNALHGAGEALDLRILPRVTFTDPEVASVGLTQKQAREAGREVGIGFASLVDAEKAQIDGQRHGHVKVVADAATGELLGCHVVAETAGDMIHEAVAMMAGHVPVKAVAGAMHAYPTLSELMRSALAEAAEA
ncbi:FAD-dependent oxidoreductase [Candidatus Nephthysia bennettiae]|uniref:FAD-dependent oxidoreductase n=1 Tax=Candidatus Nephthysia bennettiae TaxID=3127016 RepID=A0A934K2P0_9BACT|nr:FAD-dependent oxidoreductase [Candidatus Dormibacteraeota bacterium]MBJ7612841.1 FAD-dependent oxidoreductase [Candidatus Dormibacteraeota bacterium]